MKTQKRPTVSVVIPTLNEAKNLPYVLPKLPAWIHELIIVDGHSSDDTVAVARRLWPTVRIVTQKKRGKGVALISGFMAAKGEIIVALDADGSTDPEEIPRFVDALLAGADFVKGSRFLQGGGTADMEWHRRLGNLALLRLAEQLFGGRFTELCYGYNAFWRRLLPRLSLDTSGFEIETLMHIRAVKAKLKIVEVASFERERIHGVSNLNAISDGWRILKLMVAERFNLRNPQRVSTSLLRQGLSEAKSGLMTIQKRAA